MSGAAPSAVTSLVRRALALLPGLGLVGALGEVLIAALTLGLVLAASAAFNL
jgi:hypothetical protein